MEKFGLLKQRFYTRATVHFSSEKTFEHIRSNRCLKKQAYGKQFLTLKLRVPVFGREMKRQNINTPLSCSPSVLKSETTNRLHR